MDFKQLEAFVYVVKLKSFSKTAEKLYLTQPTISAHISSLEKELGVQLIVRSAKEALPSEEGKVLYEYAQDMLTLRDNALSAFQNISRNVSGTLCIAASSMPSQYVRPQMMSAFRSKYPDVSFNVIKCDSGEVVRSIVNRKAEIGMTGAVIESAKCVFEEFLDDRLVVITPNTERYRKIGEHGFTLQDLAREPFIIREPDSGTRRETERFLRSMHLDPASLHVVAQMDDPDAIKNSVSQGLGISIMSKTAAADFQRFGLIQTFDFDHVVLSRKLYLVRNQNHTLSPAAAAFLRFAKKEAAGSAQ